MTKQQIFTEAWNIARRAADTFGGNSSQYFSEALKQAYIISKTNYSITRMNWVKGITNSYIKITSPSGESFKIYKNVAKNYTSNKLVLELAKLSYSKISIENYGKLLYLSTRKF